MASVQLQNVTKAWGEVVVSKDINLDIHEGEFVVFVGPSGCGKSTLLRMIAGLETITSGDLFIGEKRMNDTPPAERGVGMVFQSYALYPHLSVAENMSFGLKLAGAKKEVINQRVNQVAEVRPEDNVRAIASCRNLREFLFQFIRMLNGDFNSGIFLEFLTDFSETVIAFIAVNPDYQFTFFDFGESRGGKHHRR